MTQLVCIFTAEESLDYTVGLVKKTYYILHNKIFILGLELNDELICSFNIDRNVQKKQLAGAMLVHRKRETNTIYTINSLNALIRQRNNGVLDTSFKIDWEDYKNCILTISNNELRIHKTKLYQIINVE